MNIGTFIYIFKDEIYWINKSPAKYKELFIIPWPYVLVYLMGDYEKNNNR